MIYIYTHTFVETTISLQCTKMFQNATDRTVESKRERMKKLNCLSIQREEKLWTYI